VTGVAKLVVIDDKNQYLLLQRSKHPIFSDDADLPGGTIEHGETPTEALLREVDEEIGVVLPAFKVHKVYEGSDFSNHGTVYHLYTATLTERPAVTISWEHGGYEWLGREEFLQRSRTAVDTYMHMVYSVLQSTA
jgi:mutator protein MutT